MAYMQTNFDGAGIPFTDARQTKIFIERMKQERNARREKAKALQEDQKRLGMIAQGFGLEKGEVDSMSRGELSGFIEDNINQFNRQKAQTDTILALQKFNVSRQNAESQRMQAEAQSKFAQANLMAMQGKEKILEDQRESDQQLSKFIQRHQETLEKDPNNLESKQIKNRYFDAFTAQESGQDPSVVAELFRKPTGDRYSMNPSSTLSEFEKVTDREFAKEVIEYNPVLAKSNINKMQKVYDALERTENTNDAIVGTMRQFMPNITRAMFDKESVSIQQMAEGIIQGDLKNTLGAQFTEKEGAMFLQRGFDPRLTTAQNKEKIMDALVRMIEGANNKAGMVKYVTTEAPKKFGFQTLKGYDYSPYTATFGMPDSGTSPQGNTTTKTRSGNEVLSVEDLDPTGGLGVSLPTDDNSSQ